MTFSSKATVLVTGGAGFVGCNLADRLATEGYRVRILDSLARPGVEANLDWLAERHNSLIEPVITDLCDRPKLETAVRGVSAVFHFAAQVAVTTSLSDPESDFGVNLKGTFDLLETMRRFAPRAPVIFASTNKVYGDLSELDMELGSVGYAPASAQLAENGIDETHRLAFLTPYGCSKGAADQYVLDYARSFGMRSAVIRMSCIYGQRQFGTEDQGWVAHFLINALEGRRITLFGDGWQVRDICTVEDTCDMYMEALRKIDAISGRAFNWGGGPANAVSLRNVLDEIARVIGRQPQIVRQEWRAGDQRWFVADTRAVDSALELPPRTGWREGLRQLAQWLEDERSARDNARETIVRRAAAL